MTSIRIVPIVEGHGEVEAVRILLLRLWTELLGGELIQVVKPIRQPRGKLVKRQELDRAVHLAKLNLQATRDMDRKTETVVAQELVLLMLDMDPDPGPPCALAPQLVRWMQEDHADVDTDCVLANVEYETWFVAAGASLGLIDEADQPADPEAAGSGKGWVKSRVSRGRYSETIDQPSMTQRMDLLACRNRSPSFDKLCRVLEARL